MRELKEIVDDDSFEIFARSYTYSINSIEEIENNKELKVAIYKELLENMGNMLKHLAEETNLDYVMKKIPIYYDEIDDDNIKMILPLTIPVK